MSSIKYKQRGSTDRRSEEPAEGGVWPERRRRPERRMVEVTESTFSEWVTWMARRKNAQAKQSHGHKRNG